MSSSTKLALFVSVSVDTAERDVKAFVSSGILVPQPGQHFSGLLTGGGVHVDILEMGCGQQYVSKVLKGRENLSLETISKIEACLGIQILPTSVIKSITPINQPKKKKNRCRQADF